MVNVQSAGASTTFTGIFWAIAATETAVLTASSSVAAITKVAPASWLALKVAWTCLISVAKACSLSASQRSGAITSTAASALSNIVTFRVATSPPPITTQRAPLILIKIGKDSIPTFYPRI